MAKNRAGGSDGSSVIQTVILLVAKELLCNMLNEYLCVSV